MTYLLDSNVLISADKFYYPLKRLPQFWEWLIEMGESGKVKIPFEIYGEITDGKGLLVDWIRRNDVKKALLLEEKVNPALFHKVLDVGYQAQVQKLNASEMQKIGKDVFLVAYALADTRRVVITQETSQPKKKRGNRKIPDVCKDCSVKWLTDYKMYEVLDFNLSHL